MKNWVVAFMIAAALALILGILAAMVPAFRTEGLILSSRGWNMFAQTLLLFGISFGFL